MKELLIRENTTVKQAMKRMGEVGEKQLFVVDDTKALLGALSDGDIRKWILKGGELEGNVESICNKKPKFVKQGYKIEKVKKLMLDKKIACVPVVNEFKEVVDVLIWDEVLGSKVSRHKEKLQIPAVIMAGGKGARLDPFTKILPKPLIPIGGKPIIEIIMDKLSEFGINDFYVTINHKAKMIKSYFEEMNTKYNITYIEEENPLGTSGGLKHFQKKLKGSMLVTNCDIIIESDYSEIMSYHDENQYDLTLVVSCRHYVIPYGVCAIENGGTLKSISEKPEYDLLVNTGMYFVKNTILHLIPDNQHFNITDLINKAQEHRFKIGVFPINEKSWIDIGQWEEYHKAIKVLST